MVAPSSAVPGHVLAPLALEVGDPWTFSGRAASSRSSPSSHWTSTGRRTSSGRSSSLFMSPYFQRKRNIQQPQHFQQSGRRCSDRDGRPGRTSSGWAVLPAAEQCLSRPPHYTNKPATGTPSGRAGDPYVTIRPPSRCLHRLSSAQFLLGNGLLRGVGAGDGDRDGRCVAKDYHGEPPGVDGCATQRVW